jgi:proteasome accessory factor B
MEQLLFHSEAGMRAVELAEACGVDRRTVYRDLSLLNEFGVPIYQKSGRFHLNRKHYLANVRLSFDELLALVLAASAVACRSVSPRLSSALQKLSGSLPQPVHDHVTALIDHALRHPMDATQANALEIIAHAWGDLRQVRVWYLSRDGAKTRSLDLSTYSIEARASSGLYVIGLDNHSQKLRALRLSRIARARPLTEHYEIPAKYHLNRPTLVRKRHAKTDEPEIG